MQIVLFGPPGAGKGTQAKLLSSNLSLPHLSTGEILRSKLKDQDELALELNKIMTTGHLVSDDILNQIVSEGFESHSSSYLPCCSTDETNFALNSNLPSLIWPKRSSLNSMSPKLKVSWVLGARINDSS